MAITFVMPSAHTGAAGAVVALKTANLLNGLNLPVPDSLAAAAMKAPMPDDPGVAPAGGSLFLGIQTKTAEIAGAAAAVVLGGWMLLRKKHGGM